MLPRILLLACCVLVPLLLLPIFAGRYLLTVLILMFQFAFVGQAWNLMMGYAGQLSLGHALYVGLGAYVPAVLWLQFGISPLLGLFAGMAVAMLMAAVIGALGFRFGIEGVYFALLTIAFAEVTRVAFDHVALTGGAGGLFLPVPAEENAAWWRLDGGPVFFYFITLGLAAAGTGIVAAIRHSRPGYIWRAMRDDPQAAQALGINLFRARMLVILLSAAMTSLAGVVNAFYYRNLFPAQSFDMARSLELILAPIVGGLGTIMGPLVGAALLTPAGEALSAFVQAAGLDAPGVKAVAYGALLMVIIYFKPDGIWPWVARRLGLS
jgi:branched-chain amino acid transport system permease protein